MASLIDGQNWIEYDSEKAYPNSVEYNIQPGSHKLHATISVDAGETDIALQIWDFENHEQLYWWSWNLFTLPCTPGCTFIHEDYFYISSVYEHRRLGFVLYRKNPYTNKWEQADVEGYININVGVEVGFVNTECNLVPDELIGVKCCYIGEEGTTNVAKPNQTLNLNNPAEVVAHYYVESGGSQYTVKTFNKTTNQLLDSYTTYDKEMIRSLGTIDNNCDIEAKLIVNNEVVDTLSFKVDVDISEEFNVYIDSFKVPSKAQVGSTVKWSATIKSEYCERCLFIYKTYLKLDILINGELLYTREWWCTDNTTWEIPDINEKGSKFEMPNEEVTLKAILHWKKCEWDQWTTIDTKIATIEPELEECKEGSTKCVNTDLYQCQNGKWVLIEENSEECQQPPPPEPPVPPDIKKYLPYIIVGGALIVALSLLKD